MEKIPEIEKKELEQLRIKRAHDLLDMYKLHNDGIVISNDTPVVVTPYPHRVENNEHAIEKIKRLIHSEIRVDLYEEVEFWLEQLK